MVTIKLSELSNNTMLCVQMAGRDLGVMDKEDFLNSSEFLDMDKKDFTTIPEVTVADPLVARFDFDSILENLADEMYEDWKENVCDALKEVLNEEKINEVLANYPTYYEGERVEIDMNGETVSQSAENSKIAEL
jgi:hypothetical protein